MHLAWVILFMPALFSDPLKMYLSGGAKAAKTCPCGPRLLAALLLMGEKLRHTLHSVGANARAMIRRSCAPPASRNAVSARPAWQELFQTQGKAWRRDVAERGLQGEDSPRRLCVQIPRPLACRLACRRPGRGPRNILNVGKWS